MNQRRLAWMRPQNTGGCTMNKVLVGVVSAADFERAQASISELSSYGGYDDWLDSRYGRFMGLSLGGARRAWRRSHSTISGLVRRAQTVSKRNRARRLRPAGQAILSPPTPFGGVETSSMTMIVRDRRQSPRFPLGWSGPWSARNSAASLSAGSDLKKA